MNIKPLHDRILIQRLAEEEKTEGGLYIPDNAKEKPQQATVISKGATANSVEVGDRVLFSKYSGTELKIAGTEYLMIREEDVLAVLGE